MSTDPTPTPAAWTPPGHQPPEHSGGAEQPRFAEVVPPAGSAPGPGEHGGPAGPGPVAPGSGGPGAAAPETVVPGAPGRGRTDQAPTWQAPRWHRPGIVALRRMSLGDVLNGAVTIHRHNPKPAILLPMVIGLVGFVISVPLARNAGRVFMGRMPGDWVAGVAQGIVALSLPATVFALVTPVILQLVDAAVLGDRPDLRQVWPKVKRRLLPYIGVVVLLAVIQVLCAGIVVGAIALIWRGGGQTAGWVGGGLLVAAGVVLLVWLHVRLVLAPAAVVLEGRGVLGALRRSFQLTRKAFWPTLAVLVLSSLIVSVVTQVLRLAVALAAALLVSAIGGRDLASQEASIAMIITVTSQVLSRALTMTFATAVVALVFVNRRIITEGYDLELIRRVSSDHQPEEVPWARR